MQNRNAVMIPDVVPARVTAVPCIVQIASYIVGVELAIAAALRLIDGVDAATAKWSLALLAVGFVLWIIPCARGEGKLPTPSGDRKGVVFPRTTDEPYHSRTVAARF